ncbi:MAG: NMP kinase [Methanophagales archaeon ANME-1-THS]|nr:MAG: NMP kinase [Methanophagales archaeon ANME-1-THS]
MILGITGTPGTGKTSVCTALGLEYLDLNRVIADRGFYTGVDTERGCLIADLTRLKEYVRKADRELLVIEGHLAHFMSPDVAIVLRADPSVLTDRLTQKGFTPQKIKENVEAEVLDIILAEAVELCDVVYEVDTSGKRIEEVAALVRAIINAEVEGDKAAKYALRKQYKPGSVDWTSVADTLLEFARSERDGRD